MTDAISKAKGPAVAGSIAGLLLGSSAGAAFSSSEISVLSGLAKFLQDYGSHAFTALCLVAIVVLFRSLRKAEADKFELALTIAPLADKLSGMLAHAAKRRRESSTPSPE